MCSELKLKAQTIWIFLELIQSYQIWPYLVLSLPESGKQPIKIWFVNVFLLWTLSQKGINTHEPCQQLSDSEVKQHILGRGPTGLMTLKQNFYVFQMLR